MNINHPNYISDEIRNEIFDHYKNHNVQMAVFVPFYDLWEARSRFDFCFGAFETKEDAEQCICNYYKERMDLIRG